MLINKESKGYSAWTETAGRVVIFSHFPCMVELSRGKILHEMVFQYEIGDESLNCMYDLVVVVLVLVVLMRHDGIIV